MKINLYKHIIWDFNGTIINDINIVLKIMNELLDKRNLKKITIEKYKETFDFPVIDYYKYLGFNLEEESFDEISKYYLKKYEKNFINCDLQPYFIESINTIKNLNISNSILSASHTPYLKSQLNFLNIEQYFIKISGLKTLKGDGKLETGIKHINSLQYEPKNILYIGDTEHDYEIAKNIGCDILLVANGHNSKSRLLKLTNNVVDSLKYVYENM